MKTRDIKVSSAMIINIEAKSDIKKNEIATKLKKNNIFPIPIELEKKISPKIFHYLTWIMKNLRIIKM